MGVNNEIGILQPLAEIGKICREKGIYLHSDAAQALGKISLDVDAMNLDLVSMTAHKMYGPKGIGALYVRRNPKVRISPLLHGGGRREALDQELYHQPLLLDLVRPAK
jgi:cysteine desulfurase